MDSIAREVRLELSNNVSLARAVVSKLQCDKLDPEWYSKCKFHARIAVAVEK